MRIAIFAAALLVTGLGITSAQAGLRPEIDVPSLVQGADLIAVGRVTATSFDDARTRPIQRFWLSVDRLLKGDLVREAGPVTVRLELSDQGGEPVDDRQYGIFFLRKSVGGGAFTAVDPFHPALVASPAGGAGDAPSEGPLSAVARELTEVLGARPAILTAPLSGVGGLVSRVEIPNGSSAGEVRQPLLLHGPLVQAQIVYESAARGLQTIPYEIAGGPLQALAGSDEVLTRLWAVDCLVAMGHAEYLPLLKADLLNPSPDVFYTVRIFAQTALENVNSPDAVPALADLLGSTNVSIRRAAALAMRNIASAAIVQPLGRSALSDPDQGVRFYAVSGLARATGVGDQPAFVVYAADENRYITFWSKWLATRWPR